MFFLPLIGSNQIANLIWVKFSTWRASIALNWLSHYSNSYSVLFVYLQCMYDINLFTFHIIKQHYSFIRCDQFGVVGLILNVNLILMKFSIRRAFTARKICD